jgi:hypothetical protein
MWILRICRPRVPVLLSLASLAVVLLTGCMRVDRALVINGDGSGSYTLTVGFPEPAQGGSSSVSSKIVAPMEAFGAHIQQEGGTYHRYTSQNYVYWTYTSAFSSLAGGNGLLQEDPRQYDQNHIPVLFNDNLKISKVVGSSTTVYQVTGMISLADPQGISTSWREATESVAITMANGVSTHYGGTLTGNTVTYAIAYDQSVTIDVTGNISSTPEVEDSTRVRFVAVGLLLSLAVILAGTGGWLLRGSVKRSRRLL